MESDGDKTFYTVTMANVYADQGRYEAAARIYRHLLDQAPDRQDLQKALAEVSAKLPEAPRQWTDISAVVEQWVGMLLTCKTLGQLRRTQLPAERPEQQPSEFATR